MEAGPEQFLRRILEDLDVQHANMSDQELCKSLCTRMDLVHLAKLRAHLYRAASLDPDFPTTLFRDKMRGPAEDEQSKRRVLAADIVAMLHLVHAHGGVAAHRVQRHEHAETRRVRHRYAPLGQPPSPLLNNPPCPEPRRTFLPASEPNFLLGVGGRQGGCRASSLDKLHHLPQYSPSPPCRRVHEGPPMARTCLQKRNIFKEDFHKMASFGPQVVTAKDGEGAEPYRHTPAPFFNRSFEVAYRKPYCPPPLSPALPERRRVKHESLDDLQASTYFGPTTVSECVSGRKQSSQGRKQGAWPVKSLSLNVEEGPHNLERSFAGKPNFHRNASVVGADENRFQSPKRPVAYPGGLANDGVKTKEGALMDRVESAKRMWDKHVNGPSFHGTDGSACIGTQTEHGGQKTASRAFKHSDEESEIVGDDISDIFRFLDEMSVCDSLGVVQSSCYDSAASLKSEGDSSPERNTVKLAKSQLDRLLRSLDNTDDELKSSVSKLVARIGEIERKLESLSGVRGEISQVLSKLNKLDQKIQEPDATPASSPPDASPHVLRCHTLNVGGVRDDSPGLRATALRKNVFTRRSSHSLDDDDAESKVVEVSPRDWRTLSYSCHPDAVDKERACRAKEVDQYDFPGVLRPPKAARESYLTEHHLRPAAPPHAKGSPLYSGPRLSGPSWTADEYKRNSGNTLDRQAESLSPNKLEFWMEDVYTPGYDSLLKQREAAFRRAKACKIAALIAATFSVILVIVVPICAMKT